MLRHKDPILIPLIGILLFLFVVLVFTWGMMLFGATKTYDQPEGTNIYQGVLIRDIGYYGYESDDAPTVTVSGPDGSYVEGPITIQCAACVGEVPDIGDPTEMDQWANMYCGLLVLRWETPRPGTHEWNIEVTDRDDNRIQGTLTVGVPYPPDTSEPVMNFIPKRLTEELKGAQ